MINNRMHLVLVAIHIPFPVLRYKNLCDVQMKHECLSLNVEKFVCEAMI